MEPETSFHLQQIESIVPLGITKGDLFTSLEEIETKIEGVSKEKYLSFYKRDSRTIQTARDRVKRPLNENLVFYQVKYNCIRGGQKYVHRGKGFRQAKRSYRSEELCSAHVHFTVTQAGDQFEVTSISNVHNHDVSKETYQLLPSNKKLDEETKQVAVSLLNLKADRQTISGKDCYGPNLHIRLDDHKKLHLEKIKQSPIIYKQIVNKLIHREDCHLLVDDEDAFQGLFFCNERMKSTFDAYPEIICIDETHTFLSRKTAIYTLQIEDGNGESQLVGVAVLVTRQTPYVQWFLDTFKSICPWENIQFIMAPQSFVLENDLLIETFPHAEVCTNIFETIRMFQMDRQCNGHFSVENKATTFNFLINLMQADSELDFENIKAALIGQIPTSCVWYLESNWENFKKEWNPIMGRRIKNLLKTSNALLNDLLAIIEKTPADGSFIDFIDSLFFAVKILEDKRVHRVNSMLNKQKSRGFLFNDVRKKYQETLTEYAFLKVIGEIDQMDIVEALFVNKGSDDIVAFETRTPDILACFKTTCSYCTCAFYEAFILPCKHIFHVRQRLSKDLFIENIRTTKWTLEYYLAKCPNSEICLQNLNPTEYLNDHKKLPTDNKYNAIVSKCSTLASTSMQAPDEIFPDILTFLDNVATALTCKNYQLLQKFNFQCHLRLERNRSDSDSTFDNVEIIPEETNADDMHFSLNVANNEEISLEKNEVQDDVVVLSNPEINDRESTFTRKRGRPRKEENAKKSRRDDLPFFKRPAKERRSVILSFLLRNTNDAYKSQLLGIHNLLPEEQIDNRIAYAELTTIKKYFSEDCWKYILKLRKDKEMGDWFCCTCREKFSPTDSSIECSYCLNWSHASCSIDLDEQGDYFKCSKCHLMT